MELADINYLKNIGELSEIYKELEKRKPSTSTKLPAGGADAKGASNVKAAFKAKAKSKDNKKGAKLP